MQYYLNLKPSTNLTNRCTHNIMFRLLLWMEEAHVWMSVLFAPVIHIIAQVKSREVIIFIWFSIKCAFQKRERVVLSTDYKYFTYRLFQRNRNISYYWHLFGIFIIRFFLLSLPNRFHSVPTLCYRLQRCFNAHVIGYFICIRERRGGGWK